MRRNRRMNRSDLKKERIIMIGSSVFVLAALTMTGIYMRQGNEESQDKGYMIDFTALEDNANQKLEELARNEMDAPVDQALQDPVTEDDLDYMPLETDLMEQEPDLLDPNTNPLEGVTLPEEIAPADSNQVDLPQVANREPAPPEEEMGVAAGEEEEPVAAGGNALAAAELHFSEESVLLRPVPGEVLLPYSMEQGIYFTTLAHYRYNPAMMFAAEEGTAVAACAAGQVISIYQDPDIGTAVLLDLEVGYRALYGQLGNIQVDEQVFVEAGQILGNVAAPTIYFTEEGSNLYFKLTLNGEALNPEAFF